MVATEFLKAPVQIATLKFDFLDLMNVLEAEPIGPDNWLPPLQCDSVYAT